MSLLLCKTLAAISIFLLTLVAGLLPLRVAVRNKKILHLGDAFASGIFLSAALLHLLPDAEASFAKFHAAATSVGGGGETYPLAQLFCAISFVVLLLMERGLVVYGKYKARFLCLNGNGNSVDDKGEYGQAGNVAAPTNLCCHGASCDCTNGSATTNKNVVMPYLLLLILAVHSFIEGSAIGIGDTFASVLVIYLAVIAHKCSESLALTSNLYRYSLSIKRIAWIIFIFSFLTPLGILFASVIENAVHFSANSSLFEGLFDAVAAGTFLYLGTVHIMECEKSFEDLGEIIALILGITLMSVVAIWV